MKISNGFSHAKLWHHHMAQFNIISILSEDLTHVYAEKDEVEYGLQIHYKVKGYDNIQKDWCKTKARQLVNVHDIEKIGDGMAYNFLR